MAISVNRTLSAFNAGELSPRVWRRLDFAKRQHGVRFLQNFIPLVQGGVKRRAGTRFVASTKYLDKETRLIPFEFALTVAYILEWGHQYVRFFRDNGRIEVAAHGSSIANGEFTSDLSGWSTTGDVVWIDPENLPPESDPPPDPPPPPPPPPGGGGGGGG